MDDNINIIQIKITGPVQSGKSTVFSSIEKMLQDCGYCVAIPDGEARYNPSKTIKDARTEHRPNPDRTVFVLTEECEHYKMDKNAKTP